MLFFLLAGHALADYPLQTEAIALGKCRGSGHAVQKAVPWYYWLTAHALIHGAVVGLVLKLYALPDPIAVGTAAAETAIHWLIDYGKCARLYSIHADQGMHVLCKIAWWVIATGLVG